MTSILDRRGAPAPLILHLAAAAEISEAGARLAPVAASRDFPWGAPPSSADRKLASTIADAPQIEMSLALRAAGAARLSAMVQGLRRYQASTDRRDLAEPPVFWSSGASRILDYGPEGGRPVLIAPSLINGVDILDLDGPGERSAGSLLRWLAGRGVRPLLLDWGHPGAEEKTFDLADYVERRLIPAFDAVAEGAGAAPAVIGYCMGGALSVALATRRPASRIALIGAPWNFAAMTPMRGALAALGVVGERAALARSIDAVSNVFGAVPVAALQAVFAQLDPGLAARKFRRFADIDPQSAEARRFVLIEDWLNTGPPLAGPAAREALIDWHLENRPLHRRWIVDGSPVDPRSIEIPALIFAAAADRIAPPDATQPLANELPNATLVRPPSGHVGMIVGRDAMERTWRPLSDFLSA